MKIYQVLVQ